MLVYKEMKNKIIVCLCLVSRVQGKIIFVIKNCQYCLCKYGRVQVLGNSGNKVEMTDSIQFRMFYLLTRFTEDLDIKIQCYKRIVHYQKFIV
jgi:hypothetical protein